MAFQPNYQARNSEVGRHDKIYVSKGVCSIILLLQVHNNKSVLKQKLKIQIILLITHILRIIDPYA